MPYSFGERSLQNLNTCHEDLILIMKIAISRSKIDFGISEGYRTIARQRDLFNAGKSKIDGVTRKGKHNLVPSEACDIFCYHESQSVRKKLAYDKRHLAYIAGVIDAVVEELLDNEQINHEIRWGGNWDSDGVIDFDQNFDDYPHFELIPIDNG